MDRIAKQKLNVIFVVDVSSSMRGKRMEQVNSAISDIKDYLNDLQGESSNVDFYISILTFGTESKWLGKKEGENVETFVCPKIKAGGYSNLHLACNKLTQALTKESQGGMMPDFGGVAPIIVLLTDGHPTKWPMKEELNALKKKGWFKVALKYGIAVELNDKRTLDVLHEFVNGNGDVIECYDSNLLKNIIKIIVFTASQVKSKSASVAAGKAVSVTKNIQVAVQQALAEVDDWEW